MKIIDYVKRKIKDSAFRSLYEVIITSIIGIVSLILIGFLFAITVNLTERII